VVGRGRADGDQPAVDAERARESLGHLAADVADARLLADEHTVAIDELPSGLPHLAIRLPQQIERRRAAVLLVARRKERPDVAEIRRAQHRIDERMRNDVPV
jgi:hypothetical protein